MDDSGHTARRALLLNASYEPLRIVTWQRAFTLWFQEKVERLEFYGHFVPTVRTSYQLPAVIKLRTWVNLKKRIPVIRFSRANLYARDGYKCQYCWQVYNEKELTLDHVIPAMRGGRKNWENIVTACIKCNQKKGHKSLAECGYKILKKPKAPRWLPGSIESIRTKHTPELWTPYLFEK